MSRPILVPLDGSDFAEYALPVATGLARALRAPIALVRVHAPISPLEGEAGVPALAWWWQETRHAEQSYLERLAAGVQARSGMRTSTHLLYGSAARVLSELIERVRARLVVMTTHGRGGLGRLWLGSTADALLRESTAPIVLIRPADYDQPAPFGWTGFEHVIVALDGSERAESVLPEAVVVGGAGARYTLLRVAEPVLTSDPHAIGRAEVYVRSLEAQTEEAERYLAGVEARVRSLGLPVTSAVVAEVPVAEGIVQYAERNGADLVAVGTRGRRGLTRFAFGSVAEKVIRTSRVPLLVLGPKHRARSERAPDLHALDVWGPAPAGRE